MWWETSKRRCLWLTIWWVALGRRLRCCGSERTCSDCLAWTDFGAKIGQPAELSGEVHSIERDRQAVTYHYDVSNDFYALWLDEQMVYSCAYFEAVDEDLDTAQARKLDYLCRKLRLRPASACWILVAVGAV